MFPHQNLNFKPEVEIGVSDCKKSHLEKNLTRLKELLWIKARGWRNVSHLPHQEMRFFLGVGITGIMLIWFLVCLVCFFGLFCLGFLCVVFSCFFLGWLVGFLCNWSLSIKKTLSDKWAASSSSPGLGLGSHPLTPAPFSPSESLTDSEKSPDLHMLVFTFVKLGSHFMHRSFVKIN